MTSKMITQFRTAVAVGTPLISIRCFDNESTISEIQKLLNGESGTAVIQWDVVRGWKARNDEGKQAIASALASLGQDADLSITQSPVEQADIALNLPQNTFLFLINAHRYLTSDYPNAASFVQAICNLRDPFKSSQRTCILLGPDFTLPAELQQDVLVLDQPLPSSEELKEIVVDLVKERKAKGVHETDIEKAVEAGRGLAAFPYEQTVAMSLVKGKLDHDVIWERKCQIISDTPGLSVYDGKETFGSIGGCEQAKEFLLSVLRGKEAPNCIVFLDEFEKSMAGATSDWVGDSGVSKDILGTTLKFMEDTESEGVILVGVRGAAKSAIAKAMGREGNIPTIALDLGATQGGVVGESQARIRQAYKIINAVGAGRVYFVATCNKDTSFPPELERRFTAGKFFFDIPDAGSGYESREERDLIWPIHLAKYDIDKSQLEGVNDKGWTGAEIRNCSRMAYRQSISLQQAAKYIIPVEQSNPADLESLRRRADGKYLSANYPGVYRYPQKSGAVALPVRKFREVM